MLEPIPEQASKEREGSSAQRNDEGGEGGSKESSAVLRGNILLGNGDGTKSMG